MKIQIFQKEGQEQWISYLSYIVLWLSRAYKKTIKGRVIHKMGVSTMNGRVALDKFWLFKERYFC